MVSELKKAAIEKDAKIWERVASDLEKPTKQRCSVNLSKIDRYSVDNETIIVPGKVLGMGELKKKLVIAAYNFSGSAQQKISINGSQAITIRELVKKNPKGSRVRIIG